MNIIGWYQRFEYAIGHWLQKATESVLGCVLCAPGCFSLLRASALADENGIMEIYSKISTKPDDYIQCDQGIISSKKFLIVNINFNISARLGEDRWLCTLLLQNGKKISYVAAAQAKTYCPEDMTTLFEQRRRWAPSTSLNILDLLLSGNKTRKRNENVSLLYLVYQVRHISIKALIIKVI